MKKKKLRNKITQVVYKPPKERMISGKAKGALEGMDSELDKAVGRLMKRIKKLFK